MALLNQNIAKANPDVIANRQYIDALYKEGYGRLATNKEFEKFKAFKVKDAANYILGAQKSPFYQAPKAQVQTQTPPPPDQNLDLSYGKVPSNKSIYEDVYKNEGMGEMKDYFKKAPDEMYGLYQSLPNKADIETKLKTDRGFDKKVSQLASYDSQIDTLEKTIRNAETSLRQQYAGKVDENRLQRVLESQLKPLKGQYTDTVNTRNSLATTLQNEETLIKQDADTQWNDAMKSINATQQKYNMMKDNWTMGSNSVEQKYGIAKADQDIILADLQARQKRGETLSDYDRQLADDIAKSKAQEESQMRLLSYENSLPSKSSKAPSSTPTLTNASKAQNAGGGYNFTATIGGKAQPITMAQYAAKTGEDIEGLLKASKDANDQTILNDYLAYKQAVAQYPDREEEFYQRLAEAYPHVFKL